MRSTRALVASLVVLLPVLAATTACTPRSAHMTIVNETDVDLVLYVFAEEAGRAAAGATDDAYWYGEYDCDGAGPDLVAISVDERQIAVHGEPTCDGRTWVIDTKELQNGVASATVVNATDGQLDVAFRGERSEPVAPGGTLTGSLRYPVGGCYDFRTPHVATSDRELRAEIEAPACDGDVWTITPDDLVASG